MMFILQPSIAKTWMSYGDDPYLIELTTMLDLLEYAKLILPCLNKIM